MGRRSMLLRSITAAIVALGMVQLVGCGSKEPKPTTIAAQVIAAPTVNQDASARALPIVVRVYELKSLGAFEKADFFALYEQDEATLGADLLAKDELNLRPGSRSKIARATDPAAAYIGIIGAFHEIDSARWRVSRRLTPNADNTLTIVVGADAISIENP